MITLPLAEFWQVCRDYPDAEPKAVTALIGWLQSHHKRGEIIAADPKMIGAWLSEAAQHDLDGNGRYVELRPAESVNGRTEIFEF